MKLKINEKGINFLLILILGFLVGVAVKSEAQKRVTIGFNDYMAPRYKQDINLMAPSTPPVQNPDQNQPGDAGEAPTQPSVENQESEPTGQETQPQ